MTDLDFLTENRRNTQIVSHLTHYQAPRSRDLQQRLKSRIFSSLPDASPDSFDFSQFLDFFLRRGVATFMVLLLFGSLLLGPLQSLSSFQVVSFARASFVECTGTVYINGQQCQTGRSFRLEYGDRLVTSKKSSATIFHSRFARTFVDGGSSISLSPVSPSQSVQIQFEKGRVWHSSPSDYSQITSSVLSARVYGGALSFETPDPDRGKTQVFATVPYEVQISRSAKSLTQMTLLSDEKLDVSNRTRQYRKLPLVLGSSKDESVWTSQNLADDLEYLHVSRTELLEKRLVATRPLQRIAQTAQLPFLPYTDQVSSRLSLIDQLFADLLLSAEKGDQATASRSFQSYREHLVSLVEDISDNLDKETAVDPFHILELFEEHYGIVSLSGESDAASILKPFFVALAVEVDQDLLSTKSEKVVSTLANSELINAHKSAKDGRSEEAKTHLKSYGILTKPANTQDMIILSDIAKNSEDLKPLVMDIQNQKIEMIEEMASHKQPQDLTTNVVVGTAYRESEGDRSTSRVVGQAQSDPL